jgi:hypothetical protein
LLQNLENLYFSIVFNYLLFRSSFWYFYMDGTLSRIVDIILVIHKEHANQLLKGVFL